MVHDFFFFSSRRRHTRYWRDWSSDVCSSDLVADGQVQIKRMLTGIQPGRFGIGAMVEARMHRADSPPTIAQQPSATRVPPGTAQQPDLRPRSCRITGQVIEFEDLAPAHFVGSEYNYLGVRFNNPPAHFTGNHDGMSDSHGLPSILERGLNTASPRQALKAANCNCSEQFGAGPMEIDFNVPQSEVSMMVGFLGASAGRPDSPLRRLVLRAYDAAGNHVDAFSEPLTKDNSITHCVRVGMGSPRIVKAVLDQELESQDTDWDFAIDNLNYDHTPAAPSAVATHDLIIVRPPWDTVFYSSPTTVTALIYAP